MEENESFIEQNIPVLDFYSFILENAINNSDIKSEKVLTKERIKAYISSFLKTNQISSTVDCRTIESGQLNSLTDESLETLFTQCLDEGDFGNLKKSFVSDAISTLEILKQFVKGKQIEPISDKLEIAIVLRLFYEVYRRVVTLVRNSDNLKSYLSGLKALDSLQFPFTTDDFNVLSAQYHILISIEKGVERLNLYEYLDVEDIQKYYIHFPVSSQISKEIDKMTELSPALPELEEKIKKLKSNYHSFEVIAVFINPTFIQDILSMICPTDTFKEGIKKIIVDWQNEISHQKKLFEEFFSKKLEEIKAKKIDFSENILNIVNNIIPMIDEKKSEQEMIKQMSHVFIQSYQQTINNYRLETDLKMEQLKEIIEKKKEYCSTDKINYIKNQFNELNNTKIDFEKLFFENHFQKNPINYLFLIFLSYKQNNINFLQKILKSPYENELLRNYARDLLYQKLEDNRDKMNPDKADKTKSVYRDYFTLLTHEKENLKYKKEVLKYLIQIITQDKMAPYESFYSEMIDVFLGEIHKILDTNLFSKKINEKTLKPIEEDNLNLSIFFIKENLFSKMIDRLEEQGPSKEALKRKIDLRFRNEYNNIEEKYHKMENKL